MLRSREGTKNLDYIVSDLDTVCNTSNVEFC